MTNWINPMFTCDLCDQRKEFNDLYLIERYDHPDWRICEECYRKSGGTLLTAHMYKEN